MNRLIPTLLLLASCAPSVPSKGDTGPALPVDRDGDGVPEADDCDDTNAAVGPTAEEVCDGLDNDCDGEVDEGVLTTVYGTPMGRIRQSDRSEKRVSSGRRGGCDRR